jgi:hypothetical protein
VIFAVRLTPAEALMTAADDPRPPGQELADAATIGQLAGLHATELDHLQAASPVHGQNRAVRASLLVELLTAAPADADQRRAIKLCGAGIIGPLDLEACSLACPLLLEKCRPVAVRTVLQ